MSAVDLLQRVGLNKYEAEAYVALLSANGLTGYELGKRSSVPLSRAYDVLDRLVQRGLALVQPGDPPRYRASSAPAFVQQVRSDTLATLDALSAALTALAAATKDDGSRHGFWVVRGATNVLAQATAMLAEARQSVAISTASSLDALTPALDAARQRGCACQIEQVPPDTDNSNRLLALVDQGQALVGTLAPAEHAQAVLSTNPALAALAHTYFAGQQLRAALPAELPTAPDAWLDWEVRKQRRLWATPSADRVA